MTITNKLNLPQALVDACDTERHNEPGTISATTLLKGVKEIVLTDRHWDELTDDASNRVWAIWGQAVHALLERETVTTFVEERLSVVVGDFSVTGRIDNYDMASAEIIDYKTASVYKVKFGDYKDWDDQIKIYAWLLIRNGFKAANGRIIAMLKDWSKTEAERDSQYPKSPICVHEVNFTLADIDTIDRFIQAKVQAVSIAQKMSDNDIEACTIEQRWYSGDKYAVMRDGRKSALRVFEAEQDAKLYAEQEGKGARVEKGPGISRKCEGYCPCREFCNFYQAIKAEKEKKDGD